MPPNPGESDTGFPVTLKKRTDLKRSGTYELSANRSRYLARKLKSSEGICEICNDLPSKLIHHKDGNPLNNNLDNLEKLCHPCHTMRHTHNDLALMKLRQNIKAKLLKYCRDSQITFKDLRSLFKSLREELGVKPPKTVKKLPHLLSEDQLKAFYEALDSSNNLKHQIMLRLLLYTGLRVSELLSIRIDDIDLKARKIYINEGKGSKDRYVLFPDWFALALQAHMDANQNSKYLFESKFCKPYTTRRVQQLVKHYAEAANIPLHVHPHLFRHQLLTYLTKNKMRDAAIQLISGHSSRKSLEIYQHMGLADVEGDYQSAMKEFKGV